MVKPVINKTYLPFTEKQLLNHFAPIKGSALKRDPERYLNYYRASAKRNAIYLATVVEKRGLPISKTRLTRQIERDERFWVAACLMTYFYAAERLRLLAELMRLAIGEQPPGRHKMPWEELLDGNLHLFFEVNLPSPMVYKDWLRTNLNQRHLIPYVFDAACKEGTDEYRHNLEGATRVDAMLINATNGFSVLFEAKVLSDTSYQISFDAMRNQLARNIDVMLEQNELPHPLNKRDPQKSFFVLLTPEMFKKNPSSRLYGWLINEYRNDAGSIRRDLPHRSDTDLAGVSKRIGWLTWEDCQDVLPESCPWLVK